MINNNTETKPADPAVEGQTIVEEKVVKVTGDIQIKKYTKGRLLGKGGFARCFEFVSLDSKKIYAAKVVAKSSLVKSRAKQKLISEIKIHKALHHTNIVGFEHYFEDTENVYILLEMCHNQSLNELLKRRKTLTELEVQCFVVQLIKALKYLHSHRIIHRDLKLGNLFLTDKMELKVGDFGLATKLEFEGEKKRTVCGTPNYIAPEILDGKCGHSYEVDIWSLGVIIYTLIIGKPPFETQDVKSTYKRIKMNSYSFPERAVISDAAKSLIKDILLTDPTKRPSLDSILASDFFQLGVSVPKLLPVSVLACPPSLSYIRQFMPDAGPNGIVQKPISTTRINNMNMNDGLELNKDSSNKLLTDRKNNPSGIYTSGRTDGQTIPDTNRPNTTNYNSNKAGVQGMQGIQTRDSGKNLVSNTNTNMNGLSNDTKRIKTSTGSYINTNNILGNSTSNHTTNVLPAAEIWVKKWVDYSSKYGLGYLLSNGFTGVFFNDSSKIILNPQKLSFNYIERRQSDKQEIISTHTLSEYPKELQKKVTLLHHFRSYLEGENANKDINNMNTNPDNEKNLIMNFKNLQITETELKTDDDLSKKQACSVYVKKWMRTKHAILFRLSNKIVQVCFQDHTEIILSSESRVVTYVNKKGERLTYPLNNALESNNNEMTKRLKYTKDILTHMLHLNQGAGGTGTTGTNTGTLRMPSISGDPTGDK
jgi:polo-like kinase 1